MRKLFLLLCVAALLHNPLAARAQGMKISIGAAQADNLVPIFAGVEKGFFADEGLDPKVVMYPTGVEMVNGQLNGAQQVSALGTSPFLAGVANGFPLVMIATLHGNALSDSYSENQSIVASAQSGIGAGDLKQLSGRRIALPFGTDAQAYLANLLSQAGLSASAVHLENGQPATLATALERGDADAVSIWEPWASAALQNVKGSVRVMGGGCMACFMPGTVLTTRREISHDGDLLQRFIIGFVRSEQWVREHTNEAAEVDTHWIQGVSLSVLEASLKHSRFDPRISKLTFEGFAKKTVPQMLAAHELRNSIDPAKAVDPRFIVYAEEHDKQYFSDLPPIPAPQRLTSDSEK
jgi:sulfonate transport system substrate-binding protein